MPPRHVVSGRRVCGMDKRVAGVIELMRERSDRGASPAALAHAVNLSPSRLHELFKRETGTSPAKYLKALRLEHARELLETSFLSVKEIRARVGERDGSHFTRDFKRAFGVTPTQYRAQRTGAHSAAVEAMPPESPAPARSGHGSEEERPGHASSQPAGAAAKARRRQLRVSVRRPRGSP